MRVNDDLRKAVVFIGLNENPYFSPKGTGFLVKYDGFTYLITSKHVALGLRDAPFKIRLNLKGDGNGAGFIHFDPLAGGRWYCHNDSSIDVAIHPMNYDLSPCDVKSVPQSMLLTDQMRDEKDIGPADLAYTVGLFHLQYGAKRNLPIVHAGSIALMPTDELVKVQDWDLDDPSRGSKYIRAYLVEQQSLNGLSGAPVFVRQTLGWGDGVLPQAQLSLLGLWQGSWGMGAGAVLAAEIGHNNKLPVGMGVVVPCQAILDVLEGEEMTEHRADERRRREAAEVAEADVIPLADKDETHHLGDEVLRRMLNTPPERKAWPRECGGT